MDAYTGTSREALLTRIREALGRSGPPAEPPTPPAVDDALIRLTGSGEDLPTLFAQRAENVGAAVRRCTRAELAATLAAVLDEHEVTSAAVAEQQIPDGADLAGGLREHGIDLHEARHDRSMATLYEVDASVTGCHAALAETGTIIYNSSETAGRGHMLVPPLHVVIITPDKLLPDLLDYIATQQPATPADLPASQSLITGPSKTADIEGVLITGVHGPGKVVAILLEDQP